MSIHACMCEQVRGYNVGELAACRSFLEGAVELRLPLPVRIAVLLCVKAFPSMLVWSVQAAPVSACSAQAFCQQTSDVCALRCPSTPLV